MKTSMGSSIRSAPQNRPTAGAIGLGTDIRLGSQVVAGGALDALGRIVHLWAFRVGAAPLQIRPTRMERASRRGRV